MLMQHPTRHHTGRAGSAAAHLAETVNKRRREGTKGTRGLFASTGTVAWESARAKAPAPQDANTSVTSAAVQHIVRETSIAAAAAVEATPGTSGNREPPGVGGD